MNEHSPARFQYGGKYNNEFRDSKNALIAGQHAETGFIYTKYVHPDGVQVQHA